MIHAQVSVHQRTHFPLGLSSIGLFRAMQAGLAIAHAPRWLVWLNAFVAMILIVIVVVATVLWQHSLGIAPLLASPMNSIRDAWAHAYGNSGEEFVILFLPLAGTLFVLLSAWTHVIDVHRTGSSLTSFGLAARVASASLWPGMLLITGGCASCIAIDSITTKNPTFRSFLGDPPWAFVLIAGIPASGLVMAGWTRRALEATARPAVEVPIPPVCEGCGYDLTHRPSDGLCPECGLSVASSLQPRVRRPGSAWERKDSIRGCLRTVAEAILRPGAFYGGLQLRTPHEGIARFANLQFLAIGIGATAWLLSVFIRVRSRESQIPSQVFFFPFAFGLLIPFGAWGLHRLLSAFIVCHWIWRKALPDFRWARKVFYYESAFLWVFCLFNGLFFTSILLAGDWLSDLTKQIFGPRPLYVLGIPPEPLTVLAGNFTLCGIWVWRYHIALAAIRWSNF